MDNKIKNQKKGISLISLIITIIVIIILASIVIFQGFTAVEKAQEASFKSELADCKEQLEYFENKAKLKGDNGFNKESLFARNDYLVYNSKSEEIGGTIETIFPQISKRLKGKLEIQRGILYINTTSEKEKKWAKDLGVEEPYFKINNLGEIETAYNNLDLIDENGTLVIPDFVTGIIPRAFADVPELKHLVIPGNVKKIGNYAFSKCLNLVTVEIQDGVEEIGTKAFQGCSALESVMMADSVRKMGGLAFYYCTNLEQINLSSNITNIEQYTFCGCEKLASIVIPESVKQIGHSAFVDCHLLSKLSIPNGLNYIYPNSFGRCYALAGDINLNGNPNFMLDSDSKVFSMITENETVILNIPKSDITKFTIPDGVVTIPKNMFANLDKMTELVIPSSVTSIEMFAFSKPLNKVTIEAGSPFYEYNGGIYTASSSGGEKLVWYYKDDNGGELIANDFPEELTEISMGAFFKSNLSTVTLPNSIREIQEQLFNESKVTALHIGSQVNKINPLVAHHSDLQILTIDENNPNYKVVGDMLTNKEEDTLYMIIPHKYTISSSRVLTSFTVPDSIKKIGRYAFYCQSYMTNIDLGHGVKEIEYNAFEGTPISTIAIPESVESIGDGAFSSCNKLSSIIIYSTKPNIRANYPWGTNLGNKKDGIVWIAD